MHWIAPSEKDTATATLEKRLWDAADTATRVSANPECEATWRDFRRAKDHWSANSGLKSQEYSGGRPLGPVLGLIFLRFAEVRFAAQRAKLEKASASARRGSRVDEPAAYHAEGILYLPAEARFDYLLNRPEAENIGVAKCEVRVANSEVPSIRHSSFDIRTWSTRRRHIRQSKFVIRHCPAPHDATGRFDFVLANPPFNVNAVDTAMRVSARRQPEGTPQDLPERQDHERLKDMVGPGRRFPFGLPRTDNATATRVSAKPELAKPDRRSVGETELHYLWIQLFHSALNEKGRAGFVMANSASDARSSEQELRRQLIESRAVDVMVAGGPGAESARRTNSGNQFLN